MLDIPVGFQQTLLVSQDYYSVGSILRFLSFVSIILRILPITSQKATAPALQRKAHSSHKNVPAHFYKKR